MAKTIPDTSQPKDTSAAIASRGGRLGKLGLIAVVFAAAFGTTYFLPSTGAPAAPNPTAQVAGAIQTIENTTFKPNRETVFANLDPLTMTLQAADRVLLIGITLEVSAARTDPVDPADPLLRDAFTGYLRALDIKDLRDAAFMPQLRAQLLRRARIAIDADDIHGVLITDFLIR